MRNNRPQAAALARGIVAAALLSLASACATIQPPAAPDEPVADAVSRGFADPGLQAFVEQHGGQSFTHWPPAEPDTPTLVLTALYFDEQVRRTRALLARAQAAGHSDAAMRVGLELAARTLDVRHQVHERLLQCYAAQARGGLAEPLVASLGHNPGGEDEAAGALNHDWEEAIAALAKTLAVDAAQLRSQKLNLSAWAQLPPLPEAEVLRARAFSQRPDLLSASVDGTEQAGAGSAEDGLPQLGLRGQVVVDLDDAISAYRGAWDAYQVQQGRMVEVAQAVASSLTAHAQGASSVEAPLERERHLFYSTWDAWIGAHVALRGAWLDIEKIAPPPLDSADFLGVACGSTDCRTER